MFFAKHWRWLETRDRDWAHMTPIQGDWTISSIGLPAAVLRKIYFDNARRLLARSLPLPVMTAARVAADFAPDGKLDEPPGRRRLRCGWNTSPVMRRPACPEHDGACDVERYLFVSGIRKPVHRTEHLHPREPHGAAGLVGQRCGGGLHWHRPRIAKRYTEYEWAPTGEQLDLKLDPSGKDFAVEQRHGERRHGG